MYEVWCYPDGIREGGFLNHTFDTLEQAFAWLGTLTTVSPLPGNPFNYGTTLKDISNVVIRKKVSDVD